MPGDKVEQQWEILQEIESPAEVPISRKFSPTLKQFASWSDEELWAAIQRYRAALIGGEEPSEGSPDLRTPEWEIFSAGQLPEVSEDSTLVTRVELARDAPTWVPASEVRGEGIFLRVPEELLAVWEQRVSGSDAVAAYRDAYARFTQRALSDAVRGTATARAVGLPARRGLPRVPVRLRDDLRTRQPVSRPPVRGAPRRPDTGTVN